MKTLLTLLLVTLCAATGYGQTMKALSYNTNGVVAYSSTNALRFTNEVRFGGGDLQIDTTGGIYWSGAPRYEPETQTFYEQIQFDSPATAAATRTNLGLGATWLTNTNGANFRTAIGLGETNAATFDAVFAMNYFEVGSSSNTVNIDQDNGIQFGTPNLAAATRANLGLPLPALTNTSNVTTMRALAGSTNTNQPFSGTFTFTDGDGLNSYSAVVSNGIIVSVTEY